MVEASPIQSDGKENSEMVEASSTRSDNEEINEIAKASSTQQDRKESNGKVKANSTELDGLETSEMLESASTQSDGKESTETDETASTRSDGNESTESDETYSIQLNGSEIAEMDEVTSTQADIQIAIKKERKKLAKRQDELNDETKDFVSENKVDLARYRLLVKAIYEKNGKAVEDFIDKSLEALLDAHIDELGSTIFHLIVQVPNLDALIERLVSMASPESLARTDLDGYTALHSAARVGHTKAAKLFVGKNPNLLTLKDNTDLLPVDIAIDIGSKETAEYLLSAHVDGQKRFYVEFPDDCSYIFYGLVEANHIDLALGFLNQHPELADRHRNDDWNRTIRELARVDMGLPSGTWQSLIYHYIPVEIEKYNSIFEYKDIENQIQTSQRTSFFAKLQYKLWSALLLIVPGIKHIHDQKLLHEQTLAIVRLMIAEVTWSFEEALESLKEPMLTAATLGNHRFVEEILKAHNYSYMIYDVHGHTIFHLAVLHRQENVFNLIYNQISYVKDQTWTQRNDTKSNILHLAGSLAPSNKVPGAALQMQRELQWFKAVEGIFHRCLKVQRNIDRKTPREVFTKEHEQLVKEGEKWMKETATACSLVAALIITVVFATAYTFPGGINGEGLPNFLPKPAFKVFLVSIALALFSSTASVLMFLGILTSRYAEEDFLESLPKKLIIGLITLFFSIASMMAAFATTFHIYLQPWQWVTYLMIVLVFVPVTLFAFMQFPLLVDIFKSTYGPSIFRPMR